MAVTPLIKRQSHFVERKFIPRARGSVQQVRIGQFSASQRTAQAGTSCYFCRKGPKSSIFHSWLGDGYTNRSLTTTFLLLASLCLIYFLYCLARIWKRQQHSPSGYRIGMILVSVVPIFLGAFQTPSYIILMQKIHFRNSWLHLSAKLVLDSMQSLWVINSFCFDCGDSKPRNIKRMRLSYFLTSIFNCAH